MGLGWEIDQQSPFCPVVDFYVTVSLKGRNGNTGTLDLLSEKNSLEYAVRSRFILFGRPFTL